MGKRAPAKKSATITADTRILLLLGKEPMRMREHLAELRKQLQKAFGELDTVEFDGSTAQLAQVLDELRTFSMLQRHKLVIVDQADQFVKEQTRPALERYAEAPVADATLVLRAEKWNRGKLDTAIEKVGAKIKCDALTPAEARNWVASRAASHHRRKLDARTAELLVQRIGASSMHRLDSELGKLALMTADDEPITAELIDQVVGRSGEDEAWRVQEAILQALTRHTAASAGRSAASNRATARGSATAHAPASTAGQAITSIHELLEVHGQPPELVAYFIADLMRKLYRATLMRRQGVSDYQIGQELKLWGERSKLFMDALRRLGPDRTAAAFDRIINATTRSRKGLGSAIENLERFCVELADDLDNPGP